MKQWGGDGTTGRLGNQFACDVVKSRPTLMRHCKNPAGFEPSQDFLYCG